jgi:hypothetical protein
VERIPRHTIPARETQRHVRSHVEDSDDLTHRGYPPRRVSVRRGYPTAADMANAALIGIG